MSTASGSPFPIKLISGLAVFAMDRELAAIMMSVCGDVDLTAPAASGAAAGAGSGSGSGSLASASSILDNTGFASDSRLPLVGAAVEMAAGAAGSGSGTDRGSLVAAESKAAAGAGSGADSAAGSSASSHADAQTRVEDDIPRCGAADATALGDIDDEASGSDEDDNDNNPQYYAMTFALAKFLRVTDGAIAQCITRALPTFQTWITTLRFHDCKTDDQRRLFARVKATFGEIKSLLENAVDSENWTKSDRFNLYPLPLIEKLCAHYCPKRLPVADLDAVREFLKANPAAPLSEEKGSPGAHDVADSGADAGPDTTGEAKRQQRPAGKKQKRLTLQQSLEQLSTPASAAADAAGVGLGSRSAAGSALKAERKSRKKPGKPLPVAGFIGGVPVIDLTDASTLALLAENEECEQVLSAMVDNFSIWEPQGEEYEALREYGLRPREVSQLLQEQCQRFSEYRQEIWNWSRDPNQVTQKTVGNNIRVFLLFGGFVCHATKRHRLKPSAFDMTVFGSKQIDCYVMDFLQYLHGSRKLMFSSIANYINSLVVLAKFYFADNPLAEFSFTAECADSEFVLHGLRRVRSQTNAKAKTEAIHKPLHAQWLSWPECQLVRQECQRAHDKAVTERKSASTIHGLRKTLVCLMFYTIAPPPRCSIVRLLQWRTTLVKKRADPTRYVIDLLNNPDAPASQHKTVKYYRRAVMPLPRSMTKYLDEYRKLRNHNLHGDWVFVNSINEPYNPTLWTSFVKACFGKHSLPSTGQRKTPTPSLMRSIYVTWLNGVPYDAHDSPFLQELKVSAAEYQSHSLAIANRHYDKDVASEIRLRELVDFCDKYAQWSIQHPVAAAAGQLGRSNKTKGASGAGRRTDNVDSDDEGYPATVPFSSQSSVGSASASDAAAVGSRGFAGSAGAGSGSGSGASSGQGSFAAPILLDDAASAVHLADDDVEIVTPPSTSFGLSRAAATKSGKSAKEPPLTAAQASAIGQARLLGTSDDEDDALARGGDGGGSGFGLDSAQTDGSPSWFDHDDVEAADDHDAARGGNLDSDDDDAAPSGTDGKGDLKSETKLSRQRGGQGRGGTGSRRPPPPPPPGQQQRQQQRDDQQLYMPEHIIAKKTVRWKNLYLIHWRGFSESERTWEPAEFFDEYCTLQTTAYERKRVPVRIVSERSRNRPASRSTATASAGAAASAAGAGSGAGSGSTQSQSQTQSVLVYYEMEWKGQRETSLELASDLDSLADWPGLLKDWQAREAQRLARKHKRGDDDDGETNRTEAAEGSGAGAGSGAGSTAKTGITKGRWQPKSRRLQGLAPENKI